MNQISGTLPLYGEFDLAVAGGGFAGFGAACAAARHGLRVALIERLEVLGGAGSAGGVGNFSYGHAFAGAQGRVFDDVLTGLGAMRAIGEENGYRQIVQYAKDVPVYRTDGSGEVDRIAEREPLFYNTTFNHAVLP